MCGSILPASGRRWSGQASGASVKVLFLEIDTERQWCVAALGPAFLAATLRCHGHDAALYRVGRDGSIEGLAAAVAAAAPDLIGLSLTTRQWLRARDVAAGLRRRIAVPVIAGGLHPTFSPEETLAAEGIDAVCLGEGEAALLALVEALEAGIPLPDVALPNIQTRPGERPTLGPPIEPIDSIPFMARDLLDERHGVYHMATQRGCPFPCTYCAARMYNALYADAGTYGRRRTIDGVLAEIRALRRAGPVNYLIFLDDTFTIHHPWVFEFCARYGAEAGVPFSLHARAETMNRKLITALAEAGCRHITYGVESGSERLRREVMRRPATNDRLAEVFAWTREAGILVTANYMMGLPGETREDLEATLRLHDRLAPDDFGYFVFYPYPGTPLFTVCRERGYLPADWLERPANHRESILELPDLSRADIAAAYDRWTEVRVGLAVARHGAGGPEAARTVTADAIRSDAALG